MNMPLKRKLADEGTPESKKAKVVVENAPSPIDTSAQLESSAEAKIVNTQPKSPNLKPTITNPTVQEELG